MSTTGILSGVKVIVLCKTCVIYTPMDHAEYCPDIPFVLKEYFVCIKDYFGTLTCSAFTLAAEHGTIQYGTVLACIYIGKKKLTGLYKYLACMWSVYEVEVAKDKFLLRSHVCPQQAFRG